MDHEGTQGDGSAIDAIERYARRAARIGRIAAEERTSHEEAHEIARATAVLAARDYGRDAARARLRRSPLLHGLLAVVVLIPVASAFMPDGRGLTLFSLLSLVYVAVHVAELTIGSPVHRFAGRLPAAVQQFLSPHQVLFEQAVLQAYTERSRETGAVGCSCGVHDDAP
ncbi:hypothetical protein L332_07895 [Agrococcus pavilionensis RW1]|uniref:Uncharacterized protein n=1 Tax=Agrococcus pavilionensis RW1 TaxID=1330458 RepID=U1LPN1_9MICO|nr:hypothetical protein [Agrococcus pavilionensis]ERG64369.1 hypothetical protein L332_07895 [Agrococcus pavilionensis RW1]